MRDDAHRTRSDILDGISPGSAGGAEVGRRAVGAGDDRMVVARWDRMNHVRMFLPIIEP